MILSETDLTSLNSLLPWATAEECRRLKGILARDSPAGLAAMASGGRWMMAPHLDVLNRKLVQAAEVRGKRILVSMPPRHGKSELLSKYFPAWFLGRFPDRRVILTSYEADFAASWGRKVRDVLSEHGREIFGVSVRPDSSASNRWDIEGHLGGMVTAGIGGPVTGKGADCLPAGTLVRTECGDVDVAEISRDPRSHRVLTLSHRTFKLEWCPVLAGREVATDDLIEVETAGGHAIRCTEGHQFFLSCLAYMDADSIDRGSQLTGLVDTGSERWIESTRVTSVRRVHAPSTPVYDIQVEGNPNFFANGLLVHNCLLVDDPTKNAEEAASETVREKHKEWWRSTAYTRLEPGGSAIVIATRWHDDDLIGWLIREEPDAWEVINFPGLAEDGDALGREPGEALWPERFDREQLIEIRKSIGSHWFSSLYQGRPLPSEGGLFKKPWFAIVEASPAAAQRARYWDLASATGDASDYTVGIRMARTPEGTYFVEDVVRGRWSPHQRDEVMRQTAALDGRAVHVYVEQEPGSAGLSVIAATVRLLDGFAVHGDRPTGDKATRAGPFAAQCEAGNVRILAGTWNREFIEELIVFPFGKHDDVVDACSGAFNKLAVAQGRYGFHTTAPRPSLVGVAAPS